MKAVWIVILATATWNFTGCKSLSPPLCFAPGPGCPDPLYPYPPQYSDNGEYSRDLFPQIEEQDQEALVWQGQRLAARYLLSDEQGLRLAQTVRDFALLRERTPRDLQEFSQRLYGLNPQEIAQALGEAQLGNRERLNLLIERSARHFGTDALTLREIVRDLHGRALRENGIEL